MPISDADKALVRLFMTACFHQWEDLPGTEECSLPLRFNEHDFTRNPKDGFGCRLCQSMLSGWLLSAGGSWVHTARYSVRVYQLPKACSSNCISSGPASSALTGWLDMPPALRPQSICTMQRCDLKPFTVNNEAA